VRPKRFSPPPCRRRCPPCRRPSSPRSSPVVPSPRSPVVVRRCWPAAAVRTPRRARSRPPRLRARPQGVAQTNASERVRYKPEVLLYMYDAYASNLTAAMFFFSLLAGHAPSGPAAVPLLRVSARLRNRRGGRRSSSSSSSRGTRTVRTATSARCVTRPATVRKVPPRRLSRQAGHRVRTHAVCKSTPLREKGDEVAEQG
jgi:hypothetical protein